MHLILASASPRRADLLRAAGFAFEIRAVDIDERPRPDEGPRNLVRRLAAEKSAAALAAPAALAAMTAAHADRDDLRNLSVILGADTAVVVDNEILGKPRDDEDAARMLHRLSGRTHEVLTGVSLRAGAAEIGRVEATVVQFSRLSAADIAWYLATGEGRDKAGGYAIQGLASRFIPRIEGSYSNVVGLPIAAVVELLPEIASDPQSGYSGH